VSIFAQPCFNDRDGFWWRITIRRADQVCMYDVSLPFMRFVKQLAQRHHIDVIYWR
jgi:hypothetical protein